MAKKQTPEIPNLKKEFEITKGADGSTLKKYYNPLPYSKNEFYISFLNPFTWVSLGDQQKPDDKIHVDYYNRQSINILKMTSKRTITFQWSLFILGLVANILPFGVLFNSGIKLVVKINTLFNLYFSFCIILILEIFFAKLTYELWYFIPLYLNISKCIINCYNIYWRANNKIEISKLVERNYLLEQRMSAIIVFYAMLNISFAFLIKWLYVHNWINITGTDLTSYWSWFLFAFDNMLGITAFFDFISKTNIISISDIAFDKSFSIIKLLPLTLNIYNIVIIVSSLKIFYRLTKYKFFGVADTLT